MTIYQRAIKIAATALAIVLAAWIIGGIVHAVMSLSFAADLFTKDSDKEDITSVLGNAGRIECGAGSLNLNLLNGMERYTVQAYTRIGNGPNGISVEGGNGSTDVVFS